MVLSACSTLKYFLQASCLGKPISIPRCHGQELDETNKNCWRDGHQSIENHLQDCPKKMPKSVLLAFQKSVYVYLSYPILSYPIYLSLSIQISNFSVAWSTHQDAHDPSRHRPSACKPPTRKRARRASIVPMWVGKPGENWRKRCGLKILDSQEPSNFSG